MTQAQRDIKRKLAILRHGEAGGNISKTCRYCGISRQTYYVWKRAYDREGESALINSKPCPENPTIRVAPVIEEKILYLRRSYYLGPLRISWFMERYHGIRVSPAGVYSVLKRNGLNRLPRKLTRQGVKTHRYEKQVPGHHIQVDVKFLTLRTEPGKKIRRFQYTAIDDATRIRALKIYPRHTQENAIKFIDYVIRKFPFRIHTVRTDNGHEWQAKFHWHLADLGIGHVYIKPRSPRLNGKVERSHGTDDREFYQLLEYTDDVDLSKKLSEWEDYYNYHRPHGGLRGRSPYEVLVDKMQHQRTVSCEV